MIGPGGPPDEQVGAAVEAFDRSFGTLPTHAAGAPGRVNIIGEHTDYSGGFVLPMAIDRWCVVVGRASPDGVSRVQSVELGERHQWPGAVWRPGDDGGRGWWAYPAGAMAETARLSGGGAVALEMVVHSLVPLGSGLSSSASLLVAVVTLAAEVWGIEVGGGDRARIAQRAEREHAGVPCGIMDQLASSCGVSGHALLIDCRSETVEPVQLPAGVSVLVGDTGVRHSLGGGEYAARRRTCESAARVLGVGLLREATLPMLDEKAALLSEEERRCARHVVSENARVLEFVGRLRGGRRGDAERAWGLLGESHRSLRDDFRVSCDELDAMVGAAEGVRGVLGARMTGGGFGGCAVIVCETGRTPGAMTEIGAGYRDRTGRAGRVFEVGAVAGASSIRL